MVAVSGESNESRVIGPPGTGKTTYLSNVLNNCANRYGSENVVALSHTRAAAAELVGRETLVPRSNVGTIHAMALRTLDQCEVAQSPQYLRAFEEQTHLKMTPADPDDPTCDPSGGSDGDKLLNEYSRLRNMMVPRDLWPMDVLGFASQWEQFKGETGTVDFTDMLEGALETHYAPGRPSALIVDEVQDSTPLQFKLIQQWGQNVDTLVCAGDIDQAIYEWAGADPGVFLAHKPARQTVLAQSYRVPRAVHRLASDWISRVEEREPVEYLPTDALGEVALCPATFKAPEAALDHIEADLAAGRTVMVMGSCGYMLAPLVSILRRLGVPFANPWRVKHGGWNPLLSRGETSTVKISRCFAAPFRGSGTEIWSLTQSQMWTSITKGLFKRGQRNVLDELPADTSPLDAFLTLLAALKDPEELERILLNGTPAEAMAWFAAHVQADRTAPMPYLTAVVERGGPEALSEEPKLFVGTIHSFKGAEADSVYVFPDLSVQGWLQWTGGNRDATMRLFYVAYTRARQRLTLCYPSGSAYVQ